jgi:hypothetical protein
MYGLEERLRDVLVRFCEAQRASPGEYDVVVGTNSLGRVFGVVAWNRFDSVEVTERQKMVWDFVRSNMVPEDTRSIAAIYTRGMMEWIAEQEFKSQKTEGLPWA